MAKEYSVEVCGELAERFESANLYRPMRVGRYEPGTELCYEVTGITPAVNAAVRVLVEKFIGGGFAGQVYRVKVLSIEGSEGLIPGVEIGCQLAMKILIPPSRGSLLFRNFVYAIGFQGPFQLQCNPDAARAGALWQKFIRRAAIARFGEKRCVNDILATFVDGTLGSCGEFSNWIDGRTWRLEVDERVDLLKRWRRGEQVDHNMLGSPEFRSKYRFMNDFVSLLHEMGAYEFARQYEWTTCKSQPNCLKRFDSEPNPEEGLVAVDFRAGLALLPFLPMSPGDFRLIAKGICRGSLVQFDRGDLVKLKAFIDADPEAFSDMGDAYEQLVAVEDVYRDSLPDVTHNHVRLLYSGKLWRGIFDGAVNGWRVRNIIDDDHAKRFRKSSLATLVFFVVGLMPLLGRFVRRLWGRVDYRRHYGAMVGSWDYFARAVRGRMAEKLIDWHRDGRIGGERAIRLADRFCMFFWYLLLSWLPAGLFRFVTDWAYFRERLAYILVRPVKLYFDADLREQWLRDMVTQGKKNHLVTDTDADVILNQLNEPFIQKYLKSLAVHVCTLPVTQIVSVIVAIVYYMTHPDMEPTQRKLAVGAILVLFQVTPISPGSICRGLYVVYLVCRERNFKDYNIAVFLGFFKYVGYLAFPIQMAHHYPVLARFMAAHWATSAVHIVPVFGEKGALLEHGVFSWFYNWPLLLRRRMALRTESRVKLPKRSWHVLPIALIGAAVFILADWLYLHRVGVLPALKADIWYLAILVPLFGGMLVTLLAGGTSLNWRVTKAAIACVLMGMAYAVTHKAFEPMQAKDAEVLSSFIELLTWRVFVFGVFGAIGALLTEIFQGEPADD